ncbi:hypothetical protein [Entomomonas asaccharolytica]|uniref:Uncharacterized protein n=1 Tax=Entomomonas asaccharolytica TaxID=2785331 RepID=A0A974RW18_9GAMM|nr:hypothetical protein [Entomomonas asaccharolytica]QQP84725.1 hypothetical protein JHT90_09930 [Entomomonas asaccharolytica]
MINSHKQSIVWLLGLIGLITAISYLTVYLIPTTYHLITNGALVSLLVIGVLLLSLFTRIQNSEYAYPRWCVFIIAIILSICCQLLLKYWDPLFIDIIGRQRYWSIMAEPSRVYYLTCWALLALLLLIATCWLLLRLMKRFVVFGFYELSPWAIWVGFSAWTMGLDCYLTPSLLKTLSFDMANLFSISNENGVQWLYRGLIAVFILIKIAIAVFYQEKWFEKVQRLVWVSITIWLIMLLADMALLALSHFFISSISAVGVLVIYYLLVAMVTVLVLQLFLKQ